MIPDTTYAPEVLEELEVIKQPSLGWGVDFEAKRITGFIDEVEAVKQAAYLMLSTERYSQLIHSWNYGIETNDLYQENKYYIIPQLQNRIYDTLFQDDRITDISNFSVENNKGAYIVTLDVDTIYNKKFSLTTEVTI